MEIAGQLGKLSTCALLLTLLLILADLFVVFLEITSDLLVLRLYVLKILFASVEVVFPTTYVITAIAMSNRKSAVSKIVCYFCTDKCLFEGLRTAVVFDLQFLNYNSHLRIVCHLSLVIATLFFLIESKASPMTTEDSWNEKASANFLREIPFYFQHPPVCLNGDRGKTFLLSIFFRFAEQTKKQK